MPVRSLVVAAVVVVLLLAIPAAAEPPFDGLPWIWPGIITEDDPTSLIEIVPDGRGRRPFWESYRWEEMNVHLFRARYQTGAEIEIRVGPEWRRRRGRTPPLDWAPDGPSGPDYSTIETERGRMAAEVRYIAEVLGRLPSLYLGRILAASLDSGYWPPAANREHQMVHFLSRGNDRMNAVGAIEEMYLHEAGHLLEDEFAITDCWREAQISDGEFISVYAASDPGSGIEGDPSGPGGEDFAETLVAYFALRLRPERMTPEDRRTIRETIPARIRCMDRWGFGTERP